MPDDEITTPEAAPVTEPIVEAAPNADLAAALRENAILKAGVTLDSDAGKLLVANPGVDIASIVALSAQATPPAEATPNVAQVAAMQAAQLAQGQDAAATAARSALAAGGTGDTGLPDVHPMDLAMRAIEDGVTKDHLSRAEAMARGVAMIMNGAIKGDPRVNYTGRVAPGI